VQRLYLIAFGVIATLSSMARPEAAEEPTATSEVSDADLKELSDPTILTRRVWLETEWSKFDDGTNTVEQTLGGLWAWRLSFDQDWAIRLKLPAKFWFWSARFIGGSQHG